MKWFQADSDAPNDPKLKAIIRAGLDATRGQSAIGAVFLLWCYIANHGKRDPGLGVRADGTALDLDEMAGECLFDLTEQLTTFLDGLAARNHIQKEVWTKKRVVFLPAMWERTSSYYKSKSRTLEHESVEAVVTAVLDGAILARRGPNRPGKALPNKPNRPNRPNKRKGHPPPADDLFDGKEVGMDQITGAVNVWNTQRKPGPKVSQITEERKRATAKVLKQHPNLDDWRKVIHWANGQRWCNAPGSGEHPNWRLDFDFLTKPGNFVKYLEQANTAQPAGKDGVIGRDARKGTTGVTRGEFANALDGGTDGATDKTG